MQLHCEKAPWNSQLYNKCSSLNLQVKSLDSWGGGTSQHLLHTTSHTQPRLPHAHLRNFGNHLALVCALSLQGASKDQKDFAKTHKFPVELGGNPQAQPSHVTSPHEELQAPTAGRRDHLAFSSPVPHRGSSLHPLQLSSCGYTCPCGWMENPIVIPKQITACSFVPVGWDFSRINSCCSDQACANSRERAEMSRWERQHYIF